MIRITALLLLLGSPVFAAEVESFTVSPDLIRHEILHRPARITAAAHVPSGARAVFRIVGPLETLDVFTRGRVGGVLWSSAGRRRHRGVPAVYLVRGWPRLPRAEDLRDLDLDRECLAKTVLPADATSDDRRAFRDLLAMKTSDGFYERAESRATAEDGRATVEFVLPLGAPPGDYRVDVHILGGAEPVRRGERRVLLRRREAVTAFEELSRERDPLYAVAAVLLALGVGVVAGLLLGLGPRVP